MTKDDQTLFSGVTEPYIDPVFSITNRFKSSTHPKKINLGVGVYRDHEGRSTVLKVVNEVENEMGVSEQSKEYFPIEGFQSMITSTLSLIFGSEISDISSGKIGGVQTLSGTGAYRIACELLFKYHNVNTFYIADPTWPIHRSILEFIGVKDIHTYPYCKREKPEILFREMIETLKQAPPHSAVVLQICGHNPTGLDFSKEQWEELSSFLKVIYSLLNLKSDLIPILDLAYLGFVSGSVDSDAFPIRLLHSNQKEMLICVSFSKNLGLYNERIGILGWFTSSPKVSESLKDRACFMIRNTYSNPPAHGARVVSRILNSPNLHAKWYVSNSFRVVELKEMSDRIISIRIILLDRLKSLNFSRDWSFITKQRGLFSFTDLSKQEIEYIENKFQIFMLLNGRINMSAVTEQNVDCIANAIVEAVNAFK